MSIKNALAGIVMMCVAICSSAPADDGIDLFLKACRNRGDNPAVIRSAKVELEAEILTNRPTETDVAKRTEQVKQSIHEQMERQKDNEWMVKRLRSALEQADEFVRPQVLAQASKRLRVRVLFRASPETEHPQYRLSLQQYDVASDKWSESVQGIRENGTRGPVQGMYFDRRDGAAIVSAGAFNVGIRDVRTFGRIQGAPALMATIAFVDPSNPGSLDFSDDKIQRFKADVEAATKGKNVQPFRLVREEPFEDSIAYVVETSRVDGGKTIPMQRVWIDRSRDYICPLVENFAESGRLALKWESSGYFLHEPSGLWYPARHVYTEFEEDGTSHRRRETYEIDRSSVALNHNPSSAEFSVDLPAGCSVVDVRTEPHKKYKTAAALSLSLDNLSETISALPPEIEPPVSATAPLTSRSRTVLYVVINLLFLALVAVGLWYRHRVKRGTAAVVLAMGSILNPGCSAPHDPPVAVEDGVRVEPAILEFGQVRESDGPLTLQCEVVNAGSKSVSISHVTSGCGCTTATLADTIILPNDRVSLPVSINLRGRMGLFSNRLSVYLSEQYEPIEVSIRGTIVRDLWYDGQVVRCIADGSESTVANTFEICTADWPLVTFEVPEDGRGVSVREISRSARDNLTVIRFHAEVDMPEDQYCLRTSITLSPTDRRLKPLRIPFVCHRPALKSATPASPSTLRPSRIALGSICRGSRSGFRVFGDRRLLASLEVAGSDRMPAGVSLEIDPLDLPDAESRWVRLLVASSTPLGFFEVCIRFVANDEDGGHPVVVLGTVRNVEP
jgi:hypothetical protein